MVGGGACAETGQGETSRIDGGTPNQNTGIASHRVEGVGVKRPAVGEFSSGERAGIVGVDRRSAVIEFDIVVDEIHVGVLQGGIGAVIIHFDSVAQGVAVGIDDERVC